MGYWNASCIVVSRVFCVGGRAIMEASQLHCCRGDSVLFGAINRVFHYVFLEDVNVSIRLSLFFFVPRCLLM